SLNAWPVRAANAPDGPTLARGTHGPASPASQFFVGPPDRPAFAVLPAAPGSPTGQQVVRRGRVVATAGPPLRAGLPPFPPTAALLPFTTGPLTRTTLD